VARALLSFSRRLMSSWIGTHLLSKVAEAPPGTQTCAFGIISFHCSCPVLPAHKPYLHFDGSFTATPFGAASASSDVGKICNALCDIWKAEMGPDTLPLKYEDIFPDLWSTRLRNASAFRQLAYLPPLQDLRLFVDASTSWGVGLTIGDSCFALLLCSHWKRDGIDICCLEVVTIALLLLFLVQLGYHDLHLLVH
jgi:hypothetical protein